MQPRERGRHRDLLRVARVDARDERIDRVVEEFVAEPASHECRDRLLGLRWRGGDEGLAEQAELRTERECTGRQERAGRRRQRDQRAILHDVARVRDRARIAAGRGDADLREELVQERRRVERAVRAGLVEEAVARPRGDHAAGRVVRIDDTDDQAPLLQLERGDEAGQAAARTSTSNEWGVECMAIDR